MELPINPFEASDEESDTKDEVASSIFDNEYKQSISNVFNFKDWIDKWQLGDIAQCFIDYNMTELDTLNMNNPNYGKLSDDKRIIALLPSKPNLFSNITNGLLSLNDLRNNEKKIDKLQNCINITVLPENVNKDLITIYNYIQILQERKHRLQTVLLQQLKNKKQKNNVLFHQYREENKKKLNKIRDDIDTQFQNIDDKILQNQIKLQDTIQSEIDKIESIGIKYQTESHKMDELLSHTLEITKSAKHKMDVAMNECEDILNKYKTVDDDDDDDNKERETEVLIVGNKAESEYENSVAILTINVKLMRSSVEEDLKLPQIVYLCDLNGKIHERLLQNINDSLQLVIPS